MLIAAYKTFRANLALDESIRARPVAESVHNSVDDGILISIVLGIIGISSLVAAIYLFAIR